MSSHLSPQAKRELLLSPASKSVNALVSFSSSIDRNLFAESVRQHGGDVGRWSEETGLVSVKLPAGHLGDVADFKGVVYVETSGAFSPSQTPGAAGAD